MFGRHNHERARATDGIRVSAVGCCSRIRHVANCQSCLKLLSVFSDTWGSFTTFGGETTELPPRAALPFSPVAIATI